MVVHLPETFTQRAGEFATITHSPQFDTSAPTSAVSPPVPPEERDSLTMFDEAFGEILSSKYRIV